MQTSLFRLSKTEGTAPVKQRLWKFYIYIYIYIYIIQASFVKDDRTLLLYYF